ncbi:MAG TPA: DNA recombination protein RmuC [Verrucomicrobiae bacterium]|jgi:DNA recombination protein RmuC|nr:DNA recombination protein RmuC [Verrucomicrobiae bacterium]
MSSTAEILIGLALGIILGGVIGWLMGSRRAPAPLALDNRLETDLRQQLSQREQELAKGREEITRLNTACATADAQKQAAEKILTDQRQLHDRALAEAKSMQEKALADLRDVFKGLSAETLKQTAPEFLRLAEQSFGKFQETAKGDLTQRQEAIKGLVEPLKQQLENYQRRLQQSETSQSSALGEVKKQLEMLSQSNLSLASETQQFRVVLKSNQARGRWGEETLRRVVEAAGMSAHCDFTEQAQAGDSKPDLIVRLPGDRLIIVDAKVPDLNFLSALDSADPGTRANELTAHAKKLKETIRALAARDYPRQFPNALDHVVMFLPAESLFSAALEGDQELIVWAARERIMIATPASLIALLRSVSISWQQHAQSENAQKIAEAAQELYQRVAKFTEHFEKIRDGLNKANNAYNDAVGSYERMVKPSGEKVLKLGGGLNGKDLAEVQPLDSTLRLPPT